MQINKAELIIMQSVNLFAQEHKKLSNIQIECLRSKFSNPLQCILSVNFRTH
jgi:hypothetical protein